MPDAAVVGSGPNGLAAAVILARAGLSVTLYERADTIGGGARTAELTLPGYLHDVCSAVHPMALASPFFRTFGLSKRVDLRVPEASYAHPLDAGRAGIAWRDLDRTVEGLGVDGASWRRLLGTLSAHPHAVSEITGGSLVRFPSHPFLLAELGISALNQGSGVWDARWREDVAPALLTGVIAHANRRLPDLAAAAAGLVLATHGHAAGWPVPVGGSQTIVDAMAADFVAHGGTIETGTEITDLRQLGSGTVAIFGTSLRSAAHIARDVLPSGYRRTLERFRYGSAVAKTDFAIDGPIPWANDEVALAPTVHLGGTRAEVAAAETAVAAGRLPESPYVLLSQPSIVDATRAPAGKQTVWAYTHVPNGSTADRSEAITATIERFAPGFRDRILAATSSTAMEVADYNPNYVGGDISAGEVSLRQLIARPSILDPWSTPAKGVYLSSGAVAPGPGVHGMGGWHAARRALAREFGITSMPKLD